MTISCTVLLATVQFTGMPFIGFSEEVKVMAQQYSNKGVERGGMTPQQHNMTLNNIQAVIIEGAVGLADRAFSPILSISHWVRM